MRSDRGGNTEKFYAEVINDTPGGNENSASTSYATLTGTASTNVTIPETGKYLITFTTFGYSPDATVVTAYFRIKIDGTVVAGDSDSWFTTRTENNRVFTSFTESVELTAGTRAALIEYKVSAGTYRRAALDPCLLTIQKL